jgi:hypothetical protein
VVEAINKAVTMRLAMEELLAQEAVWHRRQATYHETGGTKQPDASVMARSMRGVLRQVLRFATFEIVMLRFCAHAVDAEPDAGGRLDRAGHINLESGAAVTLPNGLIKFATSIACTVLIASISS